MRAVPRGSVAFYVVAMSVDALLSIYQIARAVPRGSVAFYVVALSVDMLLSISIR